MHIKLSIILMLLIASPLIMAQSVATVGFDGCDYNNIQTAIDAGHSEIRLSIPPWNNRQNFRIQSRNVKIKGGYTSCRNAELNRSDNFRTIISGAADTKPVITIAGNSRQYQITLENLDIVQGSGSGFSPGGGISSFNARTKITLNNVALRSNVGQLGGGMALVGGSNSVVATDLFVSGNQAKKGGGIYCSGSNNTLLLTGNSVAAGFQIRFNEATDGNGGGVSLSNGCVMIAFSGAENRGFAINGIIANDASGNGGGVAVENGASFIYSGDKDCFYNRCNNDINPAFFSSNTAGAPLPATSGYGGALFVSGSNSYAYLSRVIVLGNNAAYGGGFAAADGGAIEMIHNSRGCDTRGFGCNELGGNNARYAGGAVHLRSGAKAEISKTTIAENESTLGTVGWLTDATTKLDLEGSIIYKNNTFSEFSGISVFYLTGRSGARPELNVSYSTMTDNDVRRPVINNLGGIVKLRSSIVYEPQVSRLYTATNNVGSVFDCLLVNDSSTIPGGFMVIEGNPRFINPASENYHVNRTTSPAVDFCDDFTRPNYTDMDNQSRGFDDPSRTNRIGPYDVGADESL